MRGAGHSGSRPSPGRGRCPPGRGSTGELGGSCVVCCAVSPASATASATTVVAATVNPNVRLPIRPPGLCTASRSYHSRPGRRRRPASESLPLQKRKSPPQRAVSRILSAFARAAFQRRRQRRDDHSSSPAITGGIKRPTRRLRTGRPIAPPYLALLRAGFCLPPMLPPARCALTAPFHPYPSARPSRARSGLGPLASSPGGLP